MDDRVRKTIKALITQGVELKCSTRNLVNATVSNVVLTDVLPCNEPPFNYSFKGICTIRQPVKDKEGDYMEFPNCEFKGSAIVIHDAEALIKYISIESGI